MSEHPFLLVRGPPTQQSPLPEDHNHHSEGICQKKAVLHVQDEHRWYLITDVPMHFMLLVCSGVHVQAAAVSADYRCGEGTTVNQKQQLTDGFGQIEARSLNNEEFGSNSGY